MFVSKYPVFGRGRILKLEMLEQLRDFPRDMINVYLDGYANGILTGCRLSVNDDDIIISPGVLYFDGVAYVLKENYIVPYTHTNETVVLKVKFTGEKEEKDFVSYGTQVFIDGETNVYQDEIELCRFKLKAGAMLRTNYVNFEDRVTEYNTVNIIHSPFAAYEKSTISPYILAHFAKEALQYKLVNPFDIAFCMQCLQNQQAVSKELIINYISTRLEVEYEDYSNERIYRYLAEILKKIQCSKGSRRDRNYVPKKILLD